MAARRVQREQALLLLYHHPTLARELRIGRPDLPRHFDDGGLVDINGAPVEVLAAVPGLSMHQAQWIVADRGHRGPFGSVDELLVRGPFGYPLDPALRESLIAIAPGPPQSLAPPLPPRHPIAPHQQTATDRPNRGGQTMPAHPAGATPSAAVSIVEQSDWPVPPN